MISKTYLDLWETTEAAADSNSGAFEELPAGKYIVRIDGVRFDEEITKDGRTLPPCLRYDLTVVDGKLSGRRAHKADFLNNAKSVQFIKKDLNTLRCVVPKDLRDLSYSLNPVITKTIELEVVHKQGDNGKTFVNMYIRRLVEIMKPGEPFAGTQPQDIPADIPF